MNGRVRVLQYLRLAAACLIYDVMFERGGVDNVSTTATRNIKTVACMCSWRYRAYTVDLYASIHVNISDHCKMTVTEAKRQSGFFGWSELCLSA